MSTNLPGPQTADSAVYMGLPPESTFTAILRLKRVSIELTESSLVVGLLVDGKPKSVTIDLATGVTR